MPSLPQAPEPLGGVAGSHGPRERNPVLQALTRQSINGSSASSKSFETHSWAISPYRGIFWTPAGGNKWVNKEACVGLSTGQPGYRDPLTPLSLPALKAAVMALGCYPLRHFQADERGSIPLALFQPPETSHRPGGWCAKALLPVASTGAGKRFQIRERTA